MDEGGFKDRDIGLGFNKKGEGIGVDVITFISGATKGDRVSLICDGVSYYVFGLAADKAHITFS